jgi:UDP-glucose 4-epimerase
MSLKNKSVLVTGGAGFIGSHLVDRLIEEQPEKLTVVDNLFLGKESNLDDAKKRYFGLNFINRDVSNIIQMRDIMKKEGTDVVFNLAVIPLPACFKEPSWVFRHNTEIALSMCELAREDAFKTLIHFSSSEAYGTSLSGAMDESHPLNGTTPYAASKGASDLLIKAYQDTFGIDASIVRPFNNYGIRQNEGSYAGVIPVTIKRIMNNIPPVIYGDGKQTRDFLYVTDTADAALKIYLEKSTRKKAVNIASGREVRIDHLIQMIADVMGFKGEILHEPDRWADVRRHIANIYLAEDLIDFKPTVELKDGLRRTVDWYLRKSTLRSKSKKEE